MCSPISSQYNLRGPDSGIQTQSYDFLSAVAYLCRKCCALEKSASLHPRTSPVKFASSPWTPGRPSAGRPCFLQRTRARCAPFLRLRSRPWCCARGHSRLSEWPSSRTSRHTMAEYMSALRRRSSPCFSTPAPAISSCRRRGARARPARRTDGRRGTLPGFANCFQLHSVFVNKTFTTSSVVVLVVLLVGFRHLFQATELLSGRT